MRINEFLKNNLKDIFPNEIAMNDEFIQALGNDED